MTKPTSVEDYLAVAPEVGRTAYEQLRAIVAQECGESQIRLSYGMPTFFIGGKRLLHCATWQSHLAIYPVPDAPHDPDLVADLAPYRRGKGTMHFRYADPWPAALITRVVRGHYARLT